MREEAIFAVCKRCANEGFACMCKENVYLNQINHFIKNVYQIIFYLKGINFSHCSSMQGIIGLAAPLSYTACLCTFRIHHIRFYTLSIAHAPFTIHFNCHSSHYYRSRLPTFRLRAFSHPHLRCYTLLFLHKAIVHNTFIHIPIQHSQSNTSLSCTGRLCT